MNVWWLLIIISLSAMAGFFTAALLTISKIDCLQRQVNEAKEAWCKGCLCPEKLQRARSDLKALEDDLITERRSKSQVVGLNRRLWNLCPDDLRKKL